MRGCVFVLVHVCVGMGPEIYKHSQCGGRHEILAEARCSEYIGIVVGTRILCMSVLVYASSARGSGMQVNIPYQNLGTRVGQSILLAAQQSLQHGVLRPEPSGSRVEAVPKREGSLAALIGWLMVVGLTLQLC